MDLVLLAQRNAATTTSFMHYCERRSALAHILPTPDKFVGDRGQTNLSQKQILEALPHTIPVNMIANEISNSLEEDILLCRKVANNFGPIVQEYFKDRNFISIGFPDEQKLEEMIGEPPSN